MLFKKSTLFLVIAIQILLAVSFVSAQSPSNSDFGKLVINGQEPLDFQSIEKWVYPFGGTSDRLAIYFSKDTRFELITGPGFEAGDQIHRFELDTFLNDRDNHKGCQGDAKVISVQWDGISPYGITSLELAFEGTCYTDNNTVISGKIFYNIEDHAVAKQHVSLVIDGVETPNLRSFHMLPDPSNPYPTEKGIGAMFEDVQFEFYADSRFTAGHNSAFTLSYYNQDTNIYTDSCTGEAEVKSVVWNQEKPYVVDEIEISFTANRCQYRYLTFPKGTFSIKPTVIIPQKVSLVVDGSETPNFKSLQMFPDPNTPYVPENYLGATYEDVRFEFYSDSGFKAGHKSNFGLHYYNEITNVYKDGCYGEAEVNSVEWNQDKPYVADEIEISFIVHYCQNTNFIVAPRGTFSIKKVIGICEADQALVDENTKLKQGIEVLNNEIDRLNLQVQDSGLIITKLELGLKEAEGQAKQYYDNLQAEIRHYDELKESTRTEIDSLNLKLQDSSSIIRKLELGLSEVQAKAQLYFNDLQAEKLRYEQLKISSTIEKEALNKQIVALKTQLADTLLRLGKKETELKTALASNASLTAQLTKSKTEVTSLKLQVTTLQSANLKLKTENTTLLKTIEELKKKLLRQRKLSK